jgi:hypothetical protein
VLIPAGTSVQRRNFAFVPRGITNDQHHFAFLVPKLNVPHCRSMLPSVQITVPFRR